MPRKYRYQLSKEQAQCARREMDLLMFALSIDPQWGIREMCYLLQCMELPKEMKRDDQITELENRLAIYRERLGFGKVWTRSQLKRAFYAVSRGDGFRRPTPAPMTKEEAEAFGPSQLPTLDVRHVLRKRVQVDLPKGPVALPRKRARG